MTKVWFDETFITGKVGTLLNVLTYPKFRRKGIATKVIKKIMEEAKLSGVSKIELSASNDGKEVLIHKLNNVILKNASLRRIFKNNGSTNLSTIPKPLYDKLGFRESTYTEMGLTII